MTTAEFRNLIDIRTDEQLLGPCLHDESVPYVFSPKPTAWDSFRNELGTHLGIERTDIRVVGSGRLGFSMKPWNNLATFRDKSDIDVAIVNAKLFNEFWVSLLPLHIRDRPLPER